MCAALLSPPFSAPPELKSLSPSLLPTSIHLPPPIPFLSVTAVTSEVLPCAGDRRARPFCVCVHVGVHVCQEGEKAHNVYSDGKMQSVDSTNLCILPAPSQS